jgi:hypothetical protein
MWKRIAETVDVPCPPCSGSGRHSVCNGIPNPGCSCADNPGVCPSCNGTKTQSKEALPWPQTTEEFQTHADDRHPNLSDKVVNPTDQPFISSSAHGADAAHDNSDHTHVRLHRSRLKV